MVDIILVLQWFAMVSVSRHYQLDLAFFDGSLLAFDAQDLVAVVEIEIDDAMGKGLLKEEKDESGNLLIFHIGLEYFYNFHADSYCRVSEEEKC